ncbi:hypothetical protein Tco_1504412 [Tanacetum coccineum]
MLDEICGWGGGGGNDSIVFRWFLGYFQIPSTLMIQERQHSWCPYGTFAYKSHVILAYAIAHGTRAKRCIDGYLLCYDEKKDGSLHGRTFLVFGNSSEICSPCRQDASKVAKAPIFDLNWEEASVHGEIASGGVIIRQEFTFKVIDTKGAENLGGRSSFTIENPE